MNIINALNTLVNYPHQLQGQRLLSQITRLHPELDAYQGEAKIKVYALLANKLVTDHHDFIDGQKPDFNYGVEQIDPQLRYRALDFDRHSLVFHFIAKWVTAFSKVNELQKRTKELEAVIHKQNEVIATAKQVVNSADKTIQDINKAAQPNARLN